MTKTVVHNETDPGIAIVLEEVLPGTPGRAHGVYGTCTSCGKPMHWWHLGQAIQASQVHVDGHEPELIGGDTDALVR